jgi:hypothetical protein
MLFVSPGDAPPASTQDAPTMNLWPLTSAISETVYRADPETVDEFTCPVFASSLFMRIDCRIAGGQYVYTYASISMDMETGKAGLLPSSRMEDSFGDMIPA